MAGVLVGATDLDMLAHVLFGAVTAGVLGMARSAEPAIERERFRTVMLALMAGLVRPDVRPASVAGIGFHQDFICRIRLGNR